MPLALAHRDSKCVGNDERGNRERDHHEHQKECVDGVEDIDCRAVVVLLGFRSRLHDVIGWQLPGDSRLHCGGVRSLLKVDRHVRDRAIHDVREFFLVHHDHGCPGHARAEFEPAHHVHGNGFVDVNHDLVSHLDAGAHGRRFFDDDLAGLRGTAFEHSFLVHFRSEVEAQRWRLCNVGGCAGVVVNVCIDTPDGKC